VPSVLSAKLALGSFARIQPPSVDCAGGRASDNRSRNIRARPVYPRQFLETFKKLNEHFPRRLATVLDIQLLTGGLTVGRSLTRRIRRPT
jgi:hypothetical protein